MSTTAEQLGQLHNYPQINEGNLIKLQKSTAAKPELLKEIFQSYIDETRELISEIRTGIQEDDQELYYSAVHSLKGLSATIGCSRMFQLLRIMDSLNKENQYAESQSCYRHLEATFAETESVIKNRILS